MSWLRTPEVSNPRRALISALFLITLLGATLRLHGLTEQPPLRDETLSAFTAENYVEHGLFGPTMPFHPNLRNHVLYASTRLLGTGVAGLRGPSVVMGILSLPLLALLVLRLTGDRLAAGIAAFFLAIDPVHITFSRQSIQEVHTAFWILLAVLLALQAFDEQWRLDRIAWLPLAGIGFGLAIASKHHGVFPLLVCLGLSLVSATRQSRWDRVAFAAASLVLVPLTVYLLTYLPWFGRGYGLREWLPMQLALLAEMVTHTGYVDSSTIDDRPWQWFLKPLMGYGNFSHIDGRSWVTIAMGNPLTWMLVLPAVFYLLLGQRSNRGVMLLQLLFWASYLPLALSLRPIWLLSSVAVLPFAVGLVGRFLSSWVPIEQRRWLIAFSLGALVVSLLLYPLATARGLDYGYLQPLVARFNPHP